MKTFVILLVLCVPAYAQQSDIARYVEELKRVCVAHNMVLDLTTFTCKGSRLESLPNGSVREVPPNCRLQPYRGDPRTRIMVCE